jgi:hypothetical protein
LAEINLACILSRSAPLRMNASEMEPSGLFPERCGEGEMYLRKNEGEIPFSGDMEKIEWIEID